MLADPNMIQPDMAKIPVSKGALLGGASILLAGVAIIASTRDSDPKTAPQTIENQTPSDTLNLDENSLPPVTR